MPLLFRVEYACPCHERWPLALTLTVWGVCYTLCDAPRWRQRHLYLRTRDRRLPMAMAHGMPWDDRHSLDGDVRHGFEGRPRVRKMRRRFLRVHYTRHSRYLRNRRLQLFDAWSFEAF